MKDEELAQLSGLIFSSPVTVGTKQTQDTQMNDILLARVYFGVLNQ